MPPIENEFGELPRDGRGQILDISRCELTCGLAYHVHGEGSVQVTGGAADVDTNAEATLNAVQLSDLVPANDYFTITDPLGETWGFWFAGGRIQCATKANIADQDYILVTLPDASTVSFWFQTDGDDTPAAGASAADVPIEVDIQAATDEASVAAILEPLLETNCPGLTFATVGGGLISVVADAPGSEAEIAEFVTHASFTVSLSDTIPAGAAALDNQVAIDISTGTTATNMADAIEAAIDTEFAGLLSSANVAEALTIAVDAEGEEGNDWVLTENVTNAGFTIVTFTGGDGLPDTFQVTIDDSPIMEPVTWADSDADTAIAIGNAINAFYLVNGGHFAIVEDDTVRVIQGEPGVAGTLGCELGDDATATVTQFSGDTDDVVPMYAGATEIPAEFVSIEWRPEYLVGIPADKRAKIIPIDIVPKNAEDFERWSGGMSPGEDGAEPAGETVAANSKDPIRWFNASARLVIKPANAGVWDFRVRAL